MKHLPLAVIFCKQKYYPIFCKTSTSFVCWCEVKLIIHPGTLSYKVEHLRQTNYQMIRL